MEENTSHYKGRILVVDDDPAVLNFLERFLTKKFYQVFTAKNGAEATEIVRRESLHLVLLDIRMPVMNGIEVLKEIKQINPKIGVIMITAVQEEETAQEAMKLGADDYICKPFDIEYLENSVLAKIILLTG